MKLDDIQKASIKDFFRDLTLVGATTLFLSILDNSYSDVNAIPIISYFSAPWLVRHIPYIMFGEEASLLDRLSDNYEENK